MTPLPIDGAWGIQRRALGDSRGFLSRIFCADELAGAGWHRPVAQINHTLTRREGTVRGLHYQRAPHAEMKLVNCLRGEVWDVLVDLRPRSRTFLHWHAERLSAENLFALLIPEGCAHGFQTLTPDVEMLYVHSTPYADEAEAGLDPTDPRLAINWPLPISEMSLRDQSHPPLTDAFDGVELP
jgi:dTDP-4-dehydrorhamnose 3,5-epimerase